MSEKRNETDLLGKNSVVLTKVIDDKTVDETELSFEESLQDDACIRLYHKGKNFLKMKNARMEQERKRKEEELCKNLSFKPEISKRAQKLHMNREDHYKYNNDWKLRIEQDLEKKRQIKKLEEEESSKIKPVIMSKRTQSIIKKQQKNNLYNGPISGWEKRVDQYRASKSEHDDRREKTPKSDKVNRKGRESAFERLYNLAQIKRENSLDQENAIQEYYTPQAKRSVPSKKRSESKEWNRRDSRDYCIDRDYTPRSTERLKNHSNDEIFFSPTHSSSPSRYSRSFYENDDIDVIENDVTSALDDWSRLESLLR